MVKRDNLTVFKENIINEVSRTLNVAQLCSVLSVSEDKKNVDLQPLALTSTGNIRPPLLNALVSKMVQNTIQKGDVAIVVFLDRNAEHFDGTTKEYVIANDRTHSINDSVVIGLL